MAKVDIHQGLFKTNKLIFGKVENQICMEIANKFAYNLLRATCLSPLGNNAKKCPST